MGRLRGTNLGQELGGVLEVLPVDPGPQVVHDPLLDLLVNPLVCLCLQLQALVVVFPLWGQRREKAAGMQEGARFKSCSEWSQPCLADGGCASLGAHEAASSVHTPNPV